MSIDIYVAVVETWDGENIHVSASLTEEEAEAKALKDINEMCKKSFESYRDAKEAEPLDDDFCVDVYALELKRPTIHVALVEDCGLIVNCSAHTTREAAEQRALSVVSKLQANKYDSYDEMTEDLMNSEISADILSPGLDEPE